MASLSSGLTGDICTTGWLNKVGDAVFGGRRRFPLSAEPGLSSGQQLRVKVDGVDATGWTYDVAANAVVFPAGSAPARGSTVSVEYSRTCF